MGGCVGPWLPSVLDLMVGPQPSPRTTPAVVRGAEDLQALVGDAAALRRACGAVCCGLVCGDGRPNVRKWRVPRAGGLGGAYIQQSQNSMKTSPTISNNAPQPLNTLVVQSQLYSIHLYQNSCVNSNT